MAEKPMTDEDQALAEAQKEEAKRKLDEIKKENEQRKADAAKQKQLEEQRKLKERADKLQTAKYVAKLLGWHDRAGGVPCTTFLTNWCNKEDGKLESANVAKAPTKAMRELIEEITGG